MTGHLTATERDDGQQSGFHVLPAPLPPSPPKRPQLREYFIDAKSIMSSIAKSIDNGCAILVCALPPLAVLLQALRIKEKDIVANLVAIVLIGVPLLLVGGFLSAFGIDRRDWKKQLEKHRAQSNAAFDDARQVAAAATCYLATAPHLVSCYHSWLLTADNYLAMAEIEFSQRAFGPFWDRVEAAAGSLARAHDQVGALSRCAVDYYQTLQGHKHDFPPFTHVSLADSAPVTARLARVVRCGQTDFEFANIFEHRQTREVLLAGFRTLGTALAGMSYALQGAISNLSDSLSSQLAGAVDAARLDRTEMRHQLAAMRRELETQTQYLDQVRGKRRR